ncbi:MAG: hypothetical protein ACRDNP_08855 [Gaiellaceae bacterium]
MMDRPEQPRHLPLAHAVAPRMHDADADEALIAAWAAQERRDLDRVVVIAPGIGMPDLPYRRPGSPRTS